MHPAFVTPGKGIQRSINLARTASVVAFTALSGCDSASAPKGPVAAAIAIEGTPAPFELTESAQLIAKVRDKNGAVIDGAPVEWQTSAPAVVDVTGGGAISARGPGTAMITAKSGQATNTVSVTVVAPPRIVSVASGDNQQAVAGSQVTPPSVIVKHALGGPVQGVRVMFAVASGGGTITGAEVTTNANGVASVGTWTLGTAAGANTLRATTDGSGIAGNPVVFTATGSVGSPASMAMSEGNGQMAEPGTAVAVRPAVVVRDANSNPVSGVAVTFAVVSGGGTVNGPTQTTDPAGIARVESWVLGSLGPNELRASIAGGLIAGNPLTFTATGAAGLPAIVSISPTPLVPGAPATIAGTGFGAGVADNAVTIGGAEAHVIAASSNQLTVTVPCVSSGAVAVRVSASGLESPAVMHPLSVPRRSLAAGAAFIAGGSAESGCNELVSPGGNARYLVAVFSVGTSANSIVDFQLEGNPSGSLPPPIFAATSTRDAPVRAPNDPDAVRDRLHWEMLERNRADYERLRAEAQGRPTAAQAVAAQAPLPVLGDTKNIYYTFDGGCSDTTRVVQGRAIYVGSRAIIWEDASNTIQSANNAGLAGYYQRLGQIFDADQYQAVKDNFGDPLLRDPFTDNDGRIHMVFTQRLNGSGAAAYVTSCDQFSPTVARGSNLGEYFYGFVPTASGSNLGSTSFPDGWFYFMARTVIHEVKHIASHAARMSNGAPTFEASWLEEGTARHAEELWARSALHGVPWKGNTGYGSASTGGVYCDFHPESGVCNSMDALRRPSYGMRRQFNEIRDKFLAPWNWSPYGDGAGQTGSVFYQTSWSLVRYTIDRYATSEAAFYRALNNSMTNGITNLTAVAGTSIDRLIGGWGLALFADDYPGLASPSADVQFPTWNLRSIYSGLNADPAWSTRWPTPYPIQPMQLPFGPFTVAQGGMRGGAHTYYEISGNEARDQLLVLRGPNGGSPSSLLRIAVVRLQ